MNTIKFAAAAGTDMGKIRKNNEDNLYFDGKYLNEEERDIPQHYKKEFDEKTIILGVFDGMGGEELGEVASLIAAQTTDDLREDFDENINSAVSALVKTANKRICDKIIENDVSRIGTTLALACIKDDVARVYNVGDSRVYIMRDDKLKQVSVDDTSVQRLVNLGIVTKEEARHHIDKHKITQHLGIFAEDLVIEEHRSGKIALEKGDKILICSDGLTDMLDDCEIEKILASDKPIDEICDNLINTALEKGGRDNVTVIVAEALTESAIREKENKKNTIKSFLIAMVVLAALVTGFITVKTKIDRRNENKPAEEQIVRCQNMYWSTTVSEVKVGDGGALLVGVEPVNTTGNVEFCSSDPDIISVDARTGSYKALKEGKAVISASLDSVTIELNVIVEME